MRSLLLPGIVGLCLLGLRLADGAAMSLSNVVDPDAIPALVGPKAEIPPSYVEQHAGMLGASAAASLLLLAGLGWLLLRRRPALPVPAEAIARGELAPLLNQPESGEVLSRVSGILRRYLVKAFAMAPGERTTREVIEDLGKHAAPPEFTGAVTQFLHLCDERKFSPQPPRSSGAATEALHFIELAEANLAPTRNSSQALTSSRVTTP